MTKGTQLRLHDITSKAALTYGSDNWVLKYAKAQPKIRSSTNAIFEGHSLD